MKKYLLVLGLLIGVSSFYHKTEAQNISVNINIGNQPAWGPVGYDYVNYYYFPDIDVYYNVNSGFYYYFDRGRWISTRYLPYIYANYDLYGLYKVVLNINDPWMYNNIHRRDYARYIGYRGQIVIRDSRDARYRQSRNNRLVWYSSNYRPDYRPDYRPNNNRPSWNNSRPDNRSSNRNTDTRSSRSETIKPNNGNRPENSRPNNASDYNRPNNNNRSNNQEDSRSGKRESNSVRPDNKNNERGTTNNLKQVNNTERNRVTRR